MANRGVRGGVSAQSTRKPHLPLSKANSKQAESALAEKSPRLSPVRSVERQFQVCGPELPEIACFPHSEEVSIAQDFVLGAMHILHRDLVIVILYARKGCILSLASSKYYMHMRFRTSTKVFQLLAGNSVPNFQCDRGAHQICQLLTDTAEVLKPGNIRSSIPSVRPLCQISHSWGIAQLPGPLLQDTPYFLHLQV